MNRFSLFKSRKPIYNISIRRSYSNVKYPPPPSHYETRKPKGKLLKVGLAFFLIGATISYNYPLYPLGEKLMYLPDGKNEVEVKKYTDSLESKLQSLQMVKKYRNNSDYVESRGWNNLDSTNPGLSTFHSALNTPGGVAIPPICFHNGKTGDDVVILHLGRKLSGYPFIVHGGILGTIVDEVFKTNVHQEFNIDIDKIHTKSLELKYKFPTFANQFVIIRTSVKKETSSGNLYTVESDVSRLCGKLLLKANATLVADIPSESSEVRSSKWFW